MLYICLIINNHRFATIRKATVKRHLVSSSLFSEFPLDVAGLRKQDLWIIYLLNRNNS